MVQLDISKHISVSRGEIAAALIISIIAGIIASTGELLYGVALIAIVMAILIASSPVALLLIIILIGIVFAGLFRTYFPQFELIRWAVLPGSMVLVFHALTAGLAPGTDFRNHRVPGIIWWAVAFFIIVVISSIINDVAFKASLIAFKGYFQALGILFALAFINYEKRVVEQLPKLFLIIGFIQLPFVLQQYFILAPSRVGMAKGIVPIDVVSGTFGISAMGGNNSLLSAYLFICIAGCIALWQEKVWSGKVTLLVCLLLFWPTMMNEAKIGLFFLFAIFAVLFFKYAFSSFNRFILSSLVLTATVSVLLLAFVAHIHKKDEVSNPMELLQYTYESNIEKDQEWDGKLSRFGTFTYWFKEHGINNIRKTLIGHGVGMSRQKMDQKGAFITSANLNASLGIGKTGFSSILWEIGVLGLISVLGLFISGFLTAVKLSKKYSHNDMHRAIFRGVSAALAVLFVSFLSKSFFIYQVAYQTIFFTLLGYLLYWDRQSVSESEDGNEKILADNG